MLLSVIILLSFVSAKGGVGPCLATCCFGPRTGLEINEGSNVRFTEWLRLVPMVGTVIPLYSGYEGWTGKTMTKVAAEEKLGGQRVQAAAPKSKGGLWPAVVSVCWGPRVGLEMNEGRKIRTMELMMLIPVVNVIPLVVISSEAMGGKTMSQVAADEGLDR